MKVLLTSIGTRGDIEPFLAIGELLSAKGHEIVYSFPAQFTKVVNPKDNFYPLSPKMIALLESKEGRLVMGKASWVAKFKALLYLHREGQKVNKVLMHQQYEILEHENPDLIIHNVKCNYPVLWGIKYNKRTVLVSPVPYFMYVVKNRAHIGFNKNLGTFLNKLTYKLANFGLVKTIYDGQKKLPEKTGFSKSKVKQALYSNKLVYTISPQLFKRPNYWPDHVKILGYHERNRSYDWEPSSSLVQFLNNHTKVLFITFGSMVNCTAEEISSMICRVLIALKIPAVINTASGGLTKIADFDQEDKLYFTEEVSYNWIMKRVYGVIHHGGSGTTHLALKNGCASTIIPHIIDQFEWNNLVHSLGAGPKGVSINKLNARNFTRLLVDLWGNKAYKRKAEQIGFKMTDEDLQKELYDFIIT